MKVNKCCSKALVLSILFSSISNISMASSWSDDGRYESFEDSSLKIDNVLEEQDIDLEIGGNTLVNLVKLPSNKKKTTTTVSQVGTILAEFIDRKNIKPNTEYTYMVKVKVSDATDNFKTALNLDYLTEDGTHKYESASNVTTLVGNGTEVFKIKFTTGSSVSNFNNLFVIAQSIDGQSATGTQEVSSMILVEGDYLNKPVEYFEGMRSVGEFIESSDIEIDVNTENLFNMETATDGFIGIDGRYYDADCENKVSDFIRVEPGESYFYKVSNYNANVSLWTGCGFYTDKNLDSFVGPRFTRYSMEVVVNIPENVNYMRIGSRFLQQPGVSVKLVKIQDGSLDIENDNLFDKKSAVNKYIAKNGIDLSDPDKGNMTSDYISVEPGSTYIYNVEDFNQPEAEEWTGYCFYSEKDMNSNITERITTGMKDVMIKVPKNARYMRIGSRFLSNPGVKATLYKIKSISEYTNLNSKYINIGLKEPLRGMASGVKDKIVKVKDKWYIERNCKQITLTGNENWSEEYVDNTQYNNVFCVYMRISDRKIKYNYDEDLVSTKLKVYSQKDWDRDNDSECITLDGWNSNLIVKIEKSRLDTVDVDGFKKWLSKNPIEIVYQLDTPIYEELKTNTSINIVGETNNISINSCVPSNIKTTVDRVANRATEAIELAKLNPTSINIAQARYWANLMKDSTLKDDFQEQININTEVVDLSIEKKKVSSNLDVYIKSKNSLTMSLSTNNIVFDNFSGVNDMERLKALEINVSSSLPYRLNAYLESEMQNSDGSEVVDRSILNIKESTENTYQAFSGIDKKLVLKEDCVSGDNNIHNIDFNLKGGLMNKSDVYRTVIKFEAEQK